ncbi:unnamed protein product [Mesocestoides corti]|uniref:Uncharacterized protein n=2 Tax=Mesocestoides corti TaxID=53468 RepID=A0A0R3UKX6_MESCO|nr:unnamed protein product [Mesocestoides corti]
MLPRFLWMLGCSFLLLQVVGTPRGAAAAPTLFGKSEVEELPEEQVLRQYLELLRFRSLMDDDEDAESVDKRARFHPRLGKRKINFYSRLGRIVIPRTKDFVEPRYLKKPKAV